MANITITMPNAELTRIEDGFGSAHRYEEEKLVDETKNEFLLRKILAYVTTGFASGEGQVAGDSARQTAVDGANTVEITIA